VEESALLNLGATENFIDHATVARLRLGTKKLNLQRPVYNVNGTMNRHGTITHACDLMVKQGNKKVWQHFYISNLGKDRFILGLGLGRASATITKAKKRPLDRRGKEQRDQQETKKKKI